MCLDWVASSLLNVVRPANASDQPLSHQMRQLPAPVKLWQEIAVFGIMPVPPTAIALPDIQHCLQHENCLSCRQVHKDGRMEMFAKKMIIIQAIPFCLLGRTAPPGRLPWFLAGPSQ